MNVLFVHQAMPGQFGHLAAHVARAPGNRVVFLTRTDVPPPRGVTRVLYRTARPAHAGTHLYLRDMEEAVLHGQAAAGACVELARRGFRPDVIVAHPGWGEAMYLKDVFPDAALVDYCEFFYRAEGLDVGFDPEQPVDLDVAARVRTRNAPLLLALDACDRGLAPTHWQRMAHPAEWRPKIEVIHDGIDAVKARPDPRARFRLPDGRVLTRDVPVVTYVARHLEPYRGFPSFMRAAKRVLDRMPDAEIVVAGADGAGYGPLPAEGGTWRARMERELGPPPGRIHFVGTLGHGAFLDLLKVSSVHVYLTVPFVLSWSLIEALSAGCVVVGSRTPPVEEVIEDGVNGFLADFFDHEAIAGRICDALGRRDRLDELRRRARATVIGRYDHQTCLPKLERFLTDLAGTRPLRAPEAAA
jgi:glycosyltransferase involved in cell wall biosynthesis